MGSAKAQLPYHEDISITLDLKSRWEQVPGNYMILSVIINILTIYACVPETERGTSATLLDSFCVLKKLDFPEFSIGSQSRYEMSTIVQNFRKLNDQSLLSLLKLSDHYLKFYQIVSVGCP